ncbi:MAG: 50S ribosomal protein L2 [Bacteroidetes bacterium]|jgi:large subunit ribosomal protein L2|nr:50S ribosomal protein L2 [Bacteroidota bacterium]
MGIRKLKPVTPGQRFRSVSDFEEITKSSPERSLLASKKRSGGRNHSGKMTVRNIGGGHKKKYRIVDFKRNKLGIPAKVAAIEYDPNRTARLALLHYADGEKRYMLAPEGLKVGQTVVAGSQAEPVVGNALPLRNMPLGTILHAIELTPGRGAQMARSAGTYAQLTAKEDRFAVLRLPSGETRRVLLDCLATVGNVGNATHMNLEIGKAGRNRWLGRRPRTRPVAMNPVDHPMGGGEGKASGGHPRSRTGLPAKGYKTRSKTKASNQYIISRRKNKKKK